MSGAGEAAAPVLSARGLRKAFGGVVAVRDVSFDLRAGEVLAMIGPNGAGKTTCFDMLNGQLRPDAGRVTLRGRDLVGLAPRDVFRLGVGRTFQIPAAVPSMTVLENVQVALISHHRRGGDLLVPARRLYAGEAAALLARVGMGAQADRACGILAYGDLKRVELAVALANDPILLLMDEPTTGMAPAERAELMALVESIAAERGVGVLFTEHDMGVVFAHADRVIVLDGGEVIAEGTPAEVRRDERVRAVYLGGGLPPPAAAGEAGRDG